MSELTTALAACAAALALPVLAVAAGGAADGPSEAVTVDTGTALVLLAGEPLATAERTRPPQGRKIDFSSSEVKAHRARLAKLRNDFKQWLRQNGPKARVTGEYDIALNAVAVELNGSSIDLLRSAPLVQSAEYQGIYRPTSVDPALALISALPAWEQVGGPANAGAGVKVAIVDSGIDQEHPCFSDAGYPAAQRLGSPQFTNNKVIAAKVFNNKAGNRGYTPADLDGHGTHVAGTVACNHLTPATVSGVSIPYEPSGVAPRALLGNYNVFPGAIPEARSEDIMNALHAAYEDGFDVANMSLGGPHSGKKDLLTMAVDNLDRAGMVVAVAAGNEGPGKYTVGSPGSAARALTAGASTVPHFVGSQVLAGELAFDAAAGDFVTVTADLTAPLAILEGSNAATGLSEACASLPAGSLAGSIALLSRGTCFFSVKIRNAEAAGAVGVLVVNNVAGDPIAMGGDGGPTPTIPAYMLALDDGIALRDAAPDEVTITAPAYFSTGPGSADIMAGFSSWGPTDVDFRVKPDLVAPGVNVLSAQPAAVCGPDCWAFYQGTSMASPHLAGAAAVLRGRYPTWTAAQVRSAIVNTADEGVLRSHTDGTTVTGDVNVAGSGRLNLLSALGAKVALDPVSVSFGAVPSGSGHTRSATVELSTVGGAAAASVAVTDQTGGGVSYSASLSGSVVTVTMTAARGATPGHNQGTLRVYDATGAELAHAAAYTLVR